MASAILLVYCAGGGRFSVLELLELSEISAVVITVLN